MIVRTLCEAKQLSGVSHCRIPGVVVTAKGTLLTVCEARNAVSDWAGIDLALLRSEDRGATWEEPRVVVSGIATRKTVNNPVLFARPDGVVLLLYCEEYGLVGRGGVYCCESADDGKTWSAARDITAQTAPEMRNVFALGPGHGICRASGELCVPVWLVSKLAGAAEDSHHPAEVHLFSSADGGRTWQLSPKIPDGGIHDPNETSAAELADGTILLNIRAADLGCRAQTWGDGTCFSPMERTDALVDPTCFGSIASANVAGKDCVLFVNCADATARRNLTLRVSCDGGHTWPKQKTICEGVAGYADLAVDADGTAYVVFEDDDSFATLRVATIHREEWFA
ncbi:MAG: exo-alpha-sialidase [Clostridia bacterium]|nr:exo-alpha-sialidase [Clostridia bacterium]